MKYRWKAWEPVVAATCVDGSESLVLRIFIDDGAFCQLRVLLKGQQYSCCIFAVLLKNERRQWMGMATAGEVRSCGVIGFPSSFRVAPNSTFRDNLSVMIPGPRT